ncbi:hypothetical protein NQZ68_037250 [Dissostichus eleginoides]|nr:hypothetical protein NQZ68_037250 [Dissostichus eleginoides]
MKRERHDIPSQCGDITQLHPNTHSTAVMAEVIGSIKAPEFPSCRYQQDKREEEEEVRKMDITRWLLMEMPSCERSYLHISPESARSLPPPEPDCESASPEGCRSLKTREEEEEEEEMVRRWWKYEGSLVENRTHGCKKPDKACAYRGVKKQDKACAYRGVKKQDKACAYRGVKKPDKACAYRGVKKQDKACAYRGVKMQHFSICSSVTVEKSTFDRQMF